jgi:N-methylhydantoinase B
VRDFSRSSDTVPAGINAYINYTRAYASFAIRSFAGIDVPNNASIEKVIKLVAREGSFFNPRYPAAGGGRASGAHIRRHQRRHGAGGAGTRPHRADTQRH